MMLPRTAASDVPPRSHSRANGSAAAALSQSWLARRRSSQTQRAALALSTGSSALGACTDRLAALHCAPSHLDTVPKRRRCVDKPDCFAVLVRTQLLSSPWRHPKGVRSVSASVNTAGPRRTPHACCELDLVLLVDADAMLTCAVLVRAQAVESVLHFEGRATGEHLRHQAGPWPNPHASYERVRAMMIAAASRLRVRSSADCSRSPDRAADPRPDFDSPLCTDEPCLSCRSSRDGRARGGTRGAGGLGACGSTGISYRLRAAECHRKPGPDAVLPVDTAMISTALRLVSLSPMPDAPGPEASSAGGPPSGVPPEAVQWRNGEAMVGPLTIWARGCAVSVVPHVPGGVR